MASQSFITSSQPRHLTPACTGHFGVWLRPTHNSATLSLRRTVSLAAPVKRNSVRRHWESKFTGSETWLSTAFTPPARRNYPLNKDSTKHTPPAELRALNMLRKAYDKKGYVFFARQKYDLNIGGIRNPTAEPNPGCR